MRTTVRLDERLLEKAKAEARKRGEVPVSKASGGVRPGVELDDTSDLLDRLDDR